MPKLRVFCVVVAALCWLAAGPGYVGLRAAALCTHHDTMPMHAHAGDGPCYCSAMTGALDAAPAATPQAPVAPVVASGDVSGVHQVSRFPLPVSPSFTPATPPPNAIA